MSPARRWEGLEGLRGYAAFLVFLVHAFGYLGGRLYGLPPDGPQWPHVHGTAEAAIVWLNHSNYGVDLFFVLSGFLMADLAFARWPGTWRFLARRWMRIYPAYALSSLATGIVAYAWLGHALADRDVAGNALLLQGFFVLGLVAANPVTWSLSYEMAFYLAIPLFVRGARARRPACGPAWFAPLAAAYALVLLAAALAGGDKAIYFAYFALFVPGVALGALAPEERARLSARVPLAAVLAAWVGFTVAVKMEWLSNRDALYYPLSSITCTLAALKASDTGNALARMLSTAVPRILGRYSYSFFLVHYIVLQVVGEALARALPAPAPRGLYALLFLPGGLALSLAAAWLLYCATERFYFARPMRPSSATR